MAREDKEFKDVYWVCLKRYETGLRPMIKKQVFEGIGSALKCYEEWILEHEKPEPQSLIVELMFISQGRFTTLKEKHI